MIGRLSAATLAKAKVAGLVAVSLTAGGLGGAIALSRVAPVSHMVQDSAATASPHPGAGGSDGDGTTATDPETGEAGGTDGADPTTGETADGEVSPEEPTDGTDATGGRDADGTTTDSAAADDAGGGETSGDETSGDGTGTGGGGDSTNATTPDCPDDVRNHGDYTSSVAHSAAKGRHGAHGEETSQAARSDCGKSGGDAAGTSAGDGGAATGPGHANGHANGHGNGHHDGAPADPTDEGDSPTDDVPATVGTAAPPTPEHGPGNGHGHGAGGGGDDETVPGPDDHGDHGGGPTGH